MAQAAFYGIHGVNGLVVAVGEQGKIRMFKGDIYRPIEVASPTAHTLRAVWVESEWSAWACGDAGTVLRFDGEQWTCQAVATRLDALTCIWGHPDDGIWIAGRRYLLNYNRAHGGMLIDSDVSIRAIWGRHADDLWYLCAGRQAIHWTGEKAERHELPGDDDEEWTAAAGNDVDTFLLGPSGFMLHHDGRRWSEFPTDTTDLITGAVCTGPLLYVCTDGGTVREWDGRAWRTVAFSAFGPLHSVCYVDGVIWACGARGVTIQHMPEGGMP